MLSCSPTINTGQNLYEEGKYAEAISELSAFVKEHSDSALGHFMLGDALYLRYTLANLNQSSYKGDLHLAVFHFSLAVALDPHYGEAYSQRGVVRLALGDNSGAKQDYDAAITINPRLDRAYFNRGYWYEIHHLHREAIRDYETYMSLAVDELWKHETEKRLHRLRHSNLPNRGHIPEDLVL